MDRKMDGYYLGIDLNNQYAMISSFQLNKNEPETISTIAGSEMYQIPLILAKKKNIGQWYIGDEAKRAAKSGSMICIDSLWERSLAGEKIQIDEQEYEAEKLLALYLKKLIMLPQKLGDTSKCDKVILTVRELDRGSMELLWRVAFEIGLEREQFMVIDYKESFYYFALNQKSDLWLHDVFLFAYEQETMWYYAINRNTKTVPQMVTIAEGNPLKVDTDPDLYFLEVLKRVFEGRIVSSVYLVGDGFEGQWMKSCVPFLCRGRRAFMGNNLFSKGACYAGAIRDQKMEWNYVYMGENEMKFNLRIKVRDRGETKFYDLINAGENWYETTGECEVILSGSPEIVFWKQLPHSREAKIETLELTDLPQRPERTTRLRIKVKPVSDQKVEIEIHDLGFGEMFLATNKIWKYSMTM